ncbi:MAG: 50S ribosomal protein L1 [Thermoplasmata archaeon]|nr:MAG: 50S ribosomal protein L1 [Thermoplasmata archaeon]
MADKRIIQAVENVLKQSKKRKFSESVELSINLKDIDLSIPKNRIDDEIILPKGRGKDIKIVVFGSGELALKAKAVANLVIQPEELESIAKDKREARKMVNAHDFFIAEAPMMPEIGKTLGIILGPRGKMPKPIPPQADPAPMITNLKKTIRLRSKERRTFHAPIGTRNMSVDELVENIETVLNRLESKLERGRQNIASVFVKTTMGPAVRVI